MSDHDHQIEDKDHNKRHDDSSSWLNRVTSRNPAPVIAIASVASMFVSFFSVVSFVTAPIHEDLKQIHGSIEINRGHIHEITTKIGSKPRAAADVARIYGLIDGMKRELSQVHTRLDSLTIYRYSDKRKGKMLYVPNHGSNVSKERKISLTARGVK